jgi:rubrerythrin
MARAFSKLSEQEVMALAISMEEDDGRIYGDFAERFRESFPSTAATLSRMQHEESGHRQRLIDAYRARFGEHIPLIQRSDVKGLVRQSPVWLMKALSVAQVRRHIGVMELASRRFYEVSAARTADAETRRLFGDLALSEADHSALAQRFDSEQVASGARAKEDESQRRMFVLQVVQPGLAGLMDGSVSTLAPLFAAAFATHSSRDAFLVGLASSVGVCGFMTAVGGLGHTLPFMIPDFHAAFTIAVAVVLVELVIISWIRHHFMDTPFLSAAFQVIVGGLLVFFAGMLIGSS